VATSELSPNFWRKGIQATPHQGQLVAGPKGWSPGLSYTGQALYPSRPVPGLINTTPEGWLASVAPVSYSSGQKMPPDPCAGEKSGDTGLGG
jgi:hypothetical protein